jgi:hypothetical protein
MKKGPIIEICIDCPYKKHPCPEGCSRVVPDGDAEFRSKSIDYIIKKNNEDIKRKSSIKFYRRGQREYYMVSPEKVIKIVNKEHQSEVTIYERFETHMLTGYIISKSAAEEGREIAREEFAKEFEVASRLIVLEP